MGDNESEMETDKHAKMEPGAIPLYKGVGSRIKENAEAGIEQ